VPRWLPQLLKRIHELVGQGRVRFTFKALREMAALGIGLDLSDACDVLAALTSDDFVARVGSERTGEWMYVFKPVVAGGVVYLKLVVRSSCLVVSFHEDEGEDDEHRS
jgi:hypothetical protein